MDRDYYTTEEWKRIREQRRKYDGNRCKNCGNPMNLQVHHKVYGIQGEEDIKNDLVTLCVDCHRKVTLLNRRKRKVYCG